MTEVSHAVPRRYEKKSGLEIHVVKKSHSYLIPRTHQGRCFRAGFPVPNAPSSISCVNVCPEGSNDHDITT